MEYTLVRRRGQKTIRIHFNDRGELLVSCPYFVSIKKVEDFLNEKKDWISKHEKDFISHTYQQGDILPLFGKNLHLNVIEYRNNKVETTDSTITVYSKKTESDYIKRLLKKYYTEQLYEKCAPRLEFWAKQLLVRTPNLQINNSKSRWGVCYPTKNLVKISLISATLEPDLLDMIVLHETCHLLQCNHQEAFYNLMESQMPDYRQKNTRFKQFAKAGIHHNLF